MVEAIMSAAALTVGPVGVLQTLQHLVQLAPVRHRLTPHPTLDMGRCHNRRRKSHRDGGFFQETVIVELTR